ncbi:MAG: NADP(H)-dependent aldo-keto reductase [Pseudomonadales bacterium]
MKYSLLGHTDIQVSRICLGSMTWGEQNTESEAHQQLDCALEHGVNFIDTAEMYPVPPRAHSQGLTEQYIGTWLKKRADRDKLVIATKVTGPGRNMDYIRGGPRLTAAHIQTAVEESLQRLQTDYIDLYQLHWPDRNSNFFGKLNYQHNEQEESTPILETLEALDELIQQHKVRFIGVSNETPWGVMSYLKLRDQYQLPVIQTIQNPYSLLNRSFEVGLAEVSMRERVGLLAYSPLAFGTLTGKYLDDQQPETARCTRFKGYTRYFTETGIKATRAYVSLAREHGLDPAQMALAWVNSRPFTTSTIVGATNLTQLESNLASIDLTLSDEVLAGIEAIHRQYSNPCP